MATPRRNFCLLSAAALLLAACGGGGSDEQAPPPLQGSLERRTIRTGVNGSDYPLNIYLPPASAGPRDALPVVYALDGDSWFQTLVDIAETTGPRMIVVAIGNGQQRGRDYVPYNTCTPGGGGHAAFFQFLRQELIPFIQGAFGGDPARRALMGHSHGGSFVLYAMFAQPPGQHLFSAYVASDSSLGCMLGTAQAWERDYAAVNGSRLPVRLHLSYATMQGNLAENVDYVQLIARRRYDGLAMSARAWVGTHSGIVPAVLADAMPFAFAAGP